MPSLKAGEASLRALAGTHTACTHWLISWRGLEEVSLQQVTVMQQQADSPPSVQVLLRNTLLVLKCYLTQHMPTPGGVSSALPAFAIAPSCLQEPSHPVQHAPSQDCAPEHLLVSGSQEREQVLLQQAVRQVQQRCMHH